MLLNDLINKNKMKPIKEFFSLIAAFIFSIIVSLTPIVLAILYWNKYWMLLYVPILTASVYLIMKSEGKFDNKKKQ